METSQERIKKGNDKDEADNQIQGHQRPLDERKKVYIFEREIYLKPEEGARKLITASIMLAIKDYRKAYQKLILGKVTKEDLHTMEECCNYLKTLLGKAKGQVYINMAQDIAGVQMEIEEE